MILTLQWLTPSPKLELRNVKTQQLVLDIKHTS